MLQNWYNQFFVGGKEPAHGDWPKNGGGSESIRSAALPKLASPVITVDVVAGVGDDDQLIDHSTSTHIRDPTQLW